MAASHSALGYRYAALTAALTLAGLGLLALGYRLHHFVPEEGDTNG